MHAGFCKATILSFTKVPLDTKSLRTIRDEVVWESDRSPVVHGLMECVDTNDSDVGYDCVEGFRYMLYTDDKGNEGFYLGHPARGKKCGKGATRKPLMCFADNRSFWNTQDWTAMIRG
jgi:hypothetical protein